MSASTFAKTVFEALLFVFFDIKYFLGICLRCCRKSHQDELFNAVSRGSPKEVQEILDRGYKINDIMTISVKAKSQNMPLVKDSIVAGGRDFPEYISVSTETFSGQLLSSPHMDQVPFPLPVNIPLICEFLAHTH